MEILLADCGISEKSFSPPIFGFLPKALRNPKVEFAKSRSRFWWQHKVVRYHESTVNTELNGYFFGGSA